MRKNRWTVFIISFIFLLNFSALAQNEINEKADPSQISEDLNDLLPQLIQDSTRLQEFYSIYQTKIAELPEASVYIMFYQTFSKVYFHYRLYSKSLELSFMQLRFAKRSKRPVAIAEAYSSLANCYKQMSAFGNALHYYYKASQIYSIIKDSAQIAHTLNNIGLVQQQQGKIIEALENHYHSKFIYKNLNDTLTEGYVQSVLNIGRIFYLLEENSQALKAYSKALTIQHSPFFKSKESQKPYTELALVFLKNNEIELSRKYIDSSYIQLSYMPTIADEVAIIHIQGDWFMQQMLYDSAMVYYLRSLQLATQYNVIQYEAESNLNIGEIYFDLKNLEQAEKHLLLAQISAQDNNLPLLERDANFALAKLYELENEINKSLLYLKKYIKLKDSILANQRSGRLKHVAIVGQQREQIQKIETENMKALERKNMLLHITIISIITLMVFIIVVLYGYFLNKKNHRKLSAQHNELTRQKEEIRIQTLQLQNVNNKLHDLASFKHAMYNMIVHDLKNPLNAIIGLSELDPNKENLAYINQAGYEMMNLVLNILDVSKFEEMQIKIRPKETGIYESIDLAIKQIQMFVIEKKINIVKKFDPNYIIVADPDLMERIFVNLISNAVKYTPTGGTITIEHEVIHDNKGIVDRISVSDNGIGIPEDKISLLFKKFEQIEPQRLGAIRSTGLGLVFCKIAIEAHGGKIGVISEEGQGANFWFTLPRKNFPNEVS